MNVTTSGAALHGFIQHRMVPGERLYAVVDAARDRALASAASERFGLELRWLFRGPTPALCDDEEAASQKRSQTLQEAFTDSARARMADVAPYAIETLLTRRSRYLDGDFLDLWAERLGTSTGILLLTPAKPESLILHLRSAFHATDEEDHRYYFRFYDPRVLRTFLPTCTPAQGREFFGPLNRILCESDTDGKMLSCSVGSAGVVVDEEPVAALPAESGGGGSSR